MAAANVPNAHHRLIQQRQKQIDFGKVTFGYQKYKAAVPKSERKLSERFGLHPQTPNPHQECSNRSWKGQLIKWRRLLHAWDAAGILMESPSVDDSKRSMFSGVLIAKITGGNHKNNEDDNEGKKYDLNPK